MSETGNTLNTLMEGNIMKHITEDMILELNNDLSNNECPFRYKLDNFDSTIMTIKISLPSMNGVDSFIINTSQEHKEVS